MIMPKPGKTAGLPKVAAVLLGFVCSAGAMAEERDTPKRVAISGEELCSARFELAEAESYKLFAGCEAARLGLPAEVSHAVMEIESGFKPWARGLDGEVGLMQILPSTANLLGFRGTDDELSVPAVNIKYGVRYLAGAYKLAGGDLCTTVMKYRAGHGETRFSHLSVAYCLRARAILKRKGFELTGTVPVATFGNVVAAGSGGGSCVRRSFVPGPGYGRCLSAGGKVSTSKAIALRRSIFGG